MNSLIRFLLVVAPLLIVFCVNVESRQGRGVRRYGSYRFLKPNFNNGGSSDSQRNKKFYYRSGSLNSSKLAGGHGVSKRAVKRGFGLVKYLRLRRGK